MGQDVREAGKQKADARKLWYFFSSGERRARNELSPAPNKDWSQAAKDTYDRGFRYGHKQGGGE